MWVWLSMAFRMYSSTQHVTKHRDRCPSLTGIYQLGNGWYWFPRDMHVQKCLLLRQFRVVNNNNLLRKKWNDLIGTKCLGLSNKLQALWVDIEIFWTTEHTVTPKTLSILTPNAVWEVHHLTVWELGLALVELYIVHTLGYKIAPWVMWFGPQSVEIWSI